MDDPLNLPKHRVPKNLGGNGRDPVFAIGASALPTSLVDRVASYPHALVEPSTSMPLTHYEGALAGTRKSWS